VLEVRLWYERLRAITRLPAEERRAALRRFVRELLRECAAAVGIPTAMSTVAQLQLLTLHRQVSQKVADSLVAGLRWLMARSPERAAAVPERLAAVERTLASWLAELVHAPLPEDFKGELFASDTGAEHAPGATFRMVVHRLSEQPGKPPRVVGRRQWGEPVTLLLLPPWAEMAELLWRGATLAVFGARPLSREGLWSIDAHGLLVLEPERLVDVTEVAAASRPEEGVWGWVRRRLWSDELSEAAFAGWLLNFCFDELLCEPERPLQEILRRARPMRPLGFLLWERRAAESGRPQWEGERLCREAFPVLRQLALLLRQKPFLVEPTFLAPCYGMQGRLDVLLVDAAGSAETLVELKAGRPPAREAWEEHRTQVACYDLLLQAAGGRPARQRWIVYCRDARAPVRELRSNAMAFPRVMLARNRMVAAEWKLAHGEVSGETVFTALRAHPAGEELAQRFEALLPEEKAYVEELLRFLLREQWAQLREFLSSGESSPAKGAAQPGVLLRLDTEATDWERVHLCFRWEDHGVAAVGWRAGDPVVLFPCSAKGEPLLFAGPVLKGTLRLLTEETVWVSVRNKYVEPNWVKQWQQWGIVPEAGDRFLEAQWAALRQFLMAPAERRWRILGLLPPRRDGTRLVELPEGLSPDQRQVLTMALSAVDYALIQGPPGTGKTARILRTLVEMLLRVPEECLLVVAYTNRAVDEIGHVLRNAGIAFLRLGMREATEHPEALLSTRAEHLSEAEFERYVANCRVVIGTVASILMTPELFALKTFSTLLVDEASQLLESHLIGLLASVGRAILIGDERQLPAVVVQDPREAVVRDERLRQRGWRQWTDSLFERLLRQCRQHGWDSVCGMLRHQGRMHELLQQFPSIVFYGGALQPAGLEHQQREQILFRLPPCTPIEELVSRYRLLFVECLPQPEVYGYHPGEAAVVAVLVRALGRLWAEELAERHVGVITLYRRQVALIRQQLPAALRRLVTVDTVERFQGSERESIVVSFALNHHWELGFAQSLALLPDGTLVDRKLNVILTRARQQLILVGCGAVLRSVPLYRRLLSFVVRHGYWTTSDVVLGTGALGEPRRFP